MGQDSQNNDTGVLYNYFKENYFMRVFLSLARVFQIAKEPKVIF